MSLIAAGSLVLAGCSGGDVAQEVNTDESGALVVGGQTIADRELFEAAQEEDSFVLYSGSGERGEQLLLDQFAEDTGITGKLIRVVPNRLTERILSEHGAGHLGADVIRIDGWDLVDQLSTAGVFTPHTPPSELEVPEAAIYEDGAYFTAYNRAYIMAYNNQLVEEEEAPTSWEDLLKVESTGVTQVAAAGSTQLLVRFQFAELGEEWVAKQAATQPRVFDSVSPLTDSMARGEITAGPVVTTVGQTAVDSGAPLSLVAPEEGFPVNEYIFGMADGGSSPSAAEVFTNWTLSEAGQAAAVAIGDYPINAEVGIPKVTGVEMPPLDSPKVFRVSREEYMANFEADGNLWEELFGY
ncbi:ABC transporter substrate-binding protein [Salinibacterium sp. ZJ450]|uniref:ABC transporter substrate-binding protein n=1 Tax=Salinibacterium sp. ZJ450 TaxID=2708338 RepID=UPI00141DD564|nr:extracellular solute-binding protein [Salinibacterium sp. ZJ450]